MIWRTNGSLLALALLTSALAISCTTAHVAHDEGIIWSLPRSMERELEEDTAERVLYLRDPRTGEEASLFRLPYEFPEELWEVAVEQYFATPLGDEVEGPEGLSGRFFVWAQEGKAAGKVFVTAGEGATLVAFADEPARLRGLLVQQHQPKAGERTLSLHDGLGSMTPVELTPKGAAGAPRQATRVDLTFPSRLSRGYLLAEPVTRRTDASDYAARAIERGLPVSPGVNLEVWEGCDCALAVTADALLAVRVEGDGAFHLWILGPATEATAIQEERRRWAGEFLADPGAFFQEGAAGDR